MEEEQGEDSEVLVAMDGWDSEEETATANANPTTSGEPDTAATTVASGSEKS